MDPISVSHLVQDRTDELQRTADQVRRERSLRSKQTSVHAAAAVPGARPARPTEAVPFLQPATVPPADAQPSPGKAAGCTSAEHAA